MIPGQRQEVDMDFKDFDWKSAVKTVAPGLATLLGGPLAGGAVTVLAEALLGGSTGSKEGDELAIQQKLAAGMTPEDKAKILLADAEIRKEVIRAGIREKEIAADVEKTYVADAGDARKNFSGNDGVLRLGMGINLLSYVTVGAVLYGCFVLLGGASVTVDPMLAAAVGSVVGGAVQWVMANAAQANGFFFGSSPGSRQMAVDLSKAVGDAAKTGVSPRPPKG
jgi:hypothetical protein